MKYGLAIAKNYMSLHCLTIIAALIADCSTISIAAMLENRKKK
jgi:hypothetical protein